MSPRDSTTEQNSKVSTTSSNRSNSHDVNISSPFGSHSPSLQQRPSRNNHTFTHDVIKNESDRVIVGRRSHNSHVTPPRQSTADYFPTSHESDHSVAPDTTNTMDDDFHPKSYSNSAQADPLRRTRASSAQIVGNTSPPSPSLANPQTSHHNIRKRKADEISPTRSTRLSISSASTKTSSPMKNMPKVGNTQRRFSKRVKRSPANEKQNGDTVESLSLLPKKLRSQSHSMADTSLSTNDTVQKLTRSASASFKNKFVIKPSRKSIGRATRKSSAQDQDVISSQSSQGSHKDIHHKANMADNFEERDSNNGNRKSSKTPSLVFEDEASRISTEPNGNHEIDHEEANAKGIIAAELSISNPSSTVEDDHVPEILISVEDDEIAAQDDSLKHNLDVSGTATPELGFRGSSPQVIALPKRGRFSSKNKTLANIGSELQSANDSKINEGRPELHRGNSGTVLGLKKLRGGPGKRKTSKNWKLNAFYDRQMALKGQYKAVARLVQASTEILANKALQKIEVDEPHHYKVEPQYLHVVNELDRRLVKRQEEICSHHAMDEKALESWYEVKKNYEARKFESAVAVAKENAIHRVKVALLDISRGASFADFDDTGTVVHDSYCNIQEFVRPGLDRQPILKKLVPSPVATIAPVARRGRGGRRGGRGQGRWSRKDSAITEVSNAQNSEEADSFYDAPIARKASMMSIPKILDIANDDDETVQSEIDDDVTKQFSAAKSMLGNNLTNHLQNSDSARLAVDASLRSLTSTPASVFAANGLVSEQRELDGNDMMPGDHEVIVPNRRRGRGGVPNNRLIVKPWYRFEEHEIGIRPMNYKDLFFQKEAGVLNPRKVHFDHTSANGDKLVNYMEEDFDQKMVNFYGVHPKYGLPLVGCKNRDISTLGDTIEDLEMRESLRPTDFSKKLLFTNPKKMMSRGENGTLRSQSLSRSDPILRTAENFEGLTARLDVANALSVAGYLNWSKDGIATYDALARDKLDCDLVIGELVEAGDVLHKNPRAGDEMEQQVRDQLEANERIGAGTVRDEQEDSEMINLTPSRSQDVQEKVKERASTKKSNIPDLSPPKRKLGVSKNNPSPVRRSGRDRKLTTKAAENTPSPPEPRPSQPAPRAEVITPHGGSFGLSCLADACDDVTRNEAQMRMQAMQIHHMHSHDAVHNNFITYQVPPYFPQTHVHGPPPHQQAPPPHQLPRFGTFGKPPAADRRPYNMNQPGQGMPLQHMLQMPPPPPQTTQPQHNSPYLNPPPPSRQRRQSLILLPSPENGSPFLPAQQQQQPQPFYPNPSAPPPSHQTRQQPPRTTSHREIRPRTESFSFVSDNRAPMPQYMGPPPPPQAYLPPPPPPSQNPHYPSPYPPLQSFAQQQSQQQTAQQQQQGVNPLARQRLEPLNPVHAAILHGVPPPSAVQGQAQSQQTYHGRGSNRHGSLSSHPSSSSDGGRYRSG